MAKLGYFRRDRVKKTAGVGRGAYSTVLVIIGLFILAVLTGRSGAGRVQVGCR